LVPPGWSGNGHLRIAFDGNISRTNESIRHVPAACLSDCEFVFAARPMAIGAACERASQRHLRFRRRGEWGGRGLGAGARSGGPSRSGAPVAVGPGQGGAAAGRAALSTRLASGAAPSPDPRRRRQPRRRVVRARGRAALPRSGFRDRRDWGQSQGAQLHRLAPAEPRRGKIPHSAMAGPARRGARSRFGAAALGGTGRPVAAAALERLRAGNSLVAGGAVPRACLSTRALDFAR